MEGYTVWVDGIGKWHTNHDYILSGFSTRETLNAGAVQVWEIPLPSDLPSKDDWLDYRYAVERFRSKALSIAKADFKQHTITR